MNERRIIEDQLVTALAFFQQSHSRKTGGFLFLKVYAATCESETFVVIGCKHIFPIAL